MAEIVYRQMPAPQEIPPEGGGAKARMQKPQGGGKFLMQIPARGVVMAKIDSHISAVRTSFHQELATAIER